MTARYRRRSRLPSLFRRKFDRPRRFLIVTGYLESEAVEAAAPGTVILAKPFDPEQLRSAVLEVAGG